MTTPDEDQRQVVSVILRLLEKGYLPPWRKPWWSVNNPFYQVNPITKTIYKGINIWTTAATMQLRGYTDNRWVTFKEAWGWDACRGCVLIEECRQGTPIVYFNPGTPDNPYPVISFSTVFNAEQTVGCKFPTVKPPPRREPPDATRVKEIIAAIKNPPKLIWGGRKANYTPETDTIRMPSQDLFINQAGLYETWWHELAHSTGHPSRLNRWKADQHSRESLHDYAVEELVAEIATAMLMAYHSTEMPDLTNPAAYIKHWYGVIKEEPRLLIHAAERAQKVVDMIISQNEIPTPRRNKKSRK